MLKRSIPIFLIGLLGACPVAFTQDSSQAFEGDTTSVDYLLHFFNTAKNTGIQQGHLKELYKNRIPDQLAKKYLNRPIPENREEGYYTGEVKLSTDAYYALYYESPCYGENMCRMGYLTTLTKSGEFIDDMVFAYDSTTELTYDTMNSRIIQQTLIEQGKWHVRYKGGNYQQQKAFDTLMYNYFTLSDSGEIKAVEQPDFTHYRRFSYTSHRLVQYEELKLLSRKEQDIMKNEIFADYGYEFDIDRWRKFFKEKDWYEPEKEKVYDDMHIIDKMNLKRIVKYQRDIK